MRCKNKQCNKEFKLHKRNKNQAYCQRACAPYGHMRGETQAQDDKNKKLLQEMQLKENQKYLM